jgi:DNA-binding IscR family transcriptional regulator
VYSQACALKGVLAAATEAYLAVLDGVTLGQLINADGTLLRSAHHLLPSRTIASSDD